MKSMKEQKKDQSGRLKNRVKRENKGKFQPFSEKWLTYF